MLSCEKRGDVCLNQKSYRNYVSTLLLVLLPHNGELKIFRARHSNSFALWTDSSAIMVRNDFSPSGGDA